MPEETEIILVDFGPTAGVRGVANVSAVDLYEQSDAAIEKAMSTIKAMAARTVKAVKDIPVHERPSKVEVGFGLKLDMEAGAVVVKTGAEAAITVTLTWEHKNSG